MHLNRPNLLGRWRRRFQWLTSLALLLVPFGSWNGQSLLRIDLGERIIYICGQVLRIQELYLLLFFVLTFGLGFLLVTLIFGRVWCGWACPQTTLSDVAEWLARRLGLKVHHNRLQGDLWRKVLTHAGYLFLALLVAANLTWYFIAPGPFFSLLFAGRLPVAAWVTLGSIAALVYVDLGLVRRLMCREICPYGRFQTALVDAGTLALHLPETEQSRCIKCGSCVRACPMEIDIRRGYQIECINCGRCLDACRMVMHKRKEAGLITYTFGMEGKSIRALLNARSLLLGSAFCVLLVILVVAVGNRPQASLKIAVSHTAQARLLADGSLATFFSAWVSNRSEQERSYMISARDTDSGERLAIRGQTENIRLAPGTHRELSFVVLSQIPLERRPIQFLLTDAEGHQQALAEAQLSPP